MNDVPWDGKKNRDDLVRSVACLRIVGRCGSVSAAGDNANIFRGHGFTWPLNYSFIFIEEIKAFINRTEPNE